MENVENINGLLKRLFIGRQISDINFYESFSLVLITPKSPDLRITLKSNWEIESIGNWSEINKKFPIDSSELPIPYTPIQAFFLFHIAQNERIEDIIINDTGDLEIVFSNNYKILIDSFNEYHELTWVVDLNNHPAYNDFSISYNGEEKQLYVYGDWSSIS